MNNQNLATQSRKKIGGLFITILITALIVGGGVYVLTKFFLQEEAPKPPPPPAELKTFQGEKLGISFQYPAEWGEAQEIIRNVVTDDPSYGKQYVVTFTENPYVDFVGVSKGSSNPGVGGPCPIRSFFDGTEETGVLSCTNCNEGLGECADCREIKVDGQNATYFFFVPSEHCSIVGFDQVMYFLTPFNATDEDFPGLVLTQDIVTGPDVQLHDLASRATTGPPDEDEESKKQREYLLQRFLEVRDREKEKLLHNNPDNYMTSQQIDQFNNLIKSIRFISNP